MEGSRHSSRAAKIEQESRGSKGRKEEGGRRRGGGEERGGWRMSLQMDTTTGWSGGRSSRRRA